MSNELKIFDIAWNAKTAGPSPNNNERVELFLYGCNKAMNGNPCEGCFNKDLWDNSRCIYTHTPKEVVERISINSNSSYVTIGGGEPTDQYEGLVELLKLLKYYSFHILVYTWHSLFDEIDKYQDLIKYADIIVDGVYDKNNRMYIDNSGDGLFGSVGSGNQIIWSHNQDELIGYSMKSIKRLKLDNNNQLIYVLTSDDIMPYRYSFASKTFLGD